MELDAVAFIGLGIMGHPMAGHLLSAGYPLTVHTRTRARAEDLIARGAKWAASPGEAAKNASFIFICVPDTPDVQRVVMEREGILSAGSPGQVVVDHSTISPTATREIANALAARGMHLLDAPISGGDIGARNATLSIMVGGDESAFNEARPLLEKMGKTITWCGDSGSGQLTKLVNQILVTLNNLAVCEALTFAKESGLSLPKTLAAVSGGAAGSWQLTNLAPRMIGGDFRPGFMVKLQLKDLRLALQAARDAGLELAGLRQVHALFTKAMEQGHGDDGTQALYAVVEQSSKADSQSA